jgi:6-pyruvoyltetrahydropterin/6-carboxytetrahydropterin synthase
MYTVVKKIGFCYGHRLLDYAGKCAHPHGHDAGVEIALASNQLNQAGMVVDFVEIKALLKKFIEENLDHKMILRHDDVLTKTLQEMGEPVFVMKDNPTAENIARLIFEYAKQSGLPVVSVKLWETPSSYAEYHE